MDILDYFHKEKKKSASMAKDRLQIIVAHQRGSQHRHEADYLPQLKEDIMKVISKYVDIEPDAIQVQLDTNNNDCPILELNVTLPEHSKLAR